MYLIHSHCVYLCYLWHNKQLLLLLLTICLEVILQQNFQINNRRKSLYTSINHSIKADKIQNVKLKTRNIISYYVCYLQSCQLSTLENSLLGGRNLGLVYYISWNNMLFFRGIMCHFTGQYESWSVHEIIPTKCYF